MTQHPRSSSFVEQSTPSAARRGRKLGVLAAAGLTAAALLLAPGRASAQANEKVSPDGKGVVGGALLGIEVVDLTLGIIGINRGWPYLVFGALGGIGGGIGGFAVEQNTRDVPEVALYMLAGGMGLVIPTLVVSLNATMYKPPEGTSTTTYEPTTNQPGAGPAPVQPVAPSPAQPTQTRRPVLQPVLPKERMAFSLIDVHKGQLAFSLPAVSVRQLYSDREVWKFGVQQGSEVRVPLFYATF